MAHNYLEDYVQCRQCSFIGPEGCVIDHYVREELDPHEDTSALSRGYCNAKFSWESPRQTHLLNRFPSSFTTYNDHQICHQICDPQVLQHLISNKYVDHPFMA